MSLSCFTENVRNGSIYAFNLYFFESIDTANLPSAKQSRGLASKEKMTCDRSYRFLQRLHRTPFCFESLFARNKRQAKNSSINYNNERMPP
jgi:hypothetical protein